MMSISQHQNSLINMMSLLSFRNNRRIKQPEIMSTNDENTEGHITSIASQNKDYNENKSCKPISTINVPKTPVSLLQVLYCFFNRKLCLSPAKNISSSRSFDYAAYTQKYSSFRSFMSGKE